MTSTAWPRPSGSPCRTYDTLISCGDLADLLELLRLAALLEEALELDGDVEVILDRVLAAAGDDDDVVDAGLDRFLDAVLNDRLVDEDQHFLRLRLGRGKEAGAETRGGEDGFADRAGRVHRTRIVSQVESSRMLDPAFLRDNLDAVRAGSAEARRRLDAPSSRSWRRSNRAAAGCCPELEGLKREQNTAGDEVARAKRQGLDTTTIQEANRAARAADQAARASSSRRSSSAAIAAC